MTLAGRTAVITGGGRGIGAAVAKALADAGAEVTVAARTADEIEAVAESLRAAGHRAHAARCDVSDPRSVETLARETGSIEILINAAGIAGSAPIHRLTLEDWNRYLAVNATGSFLCLRAYLPGMLERGNGRIVNIASVAGLTGARYIAGYTASKHALIGLTRSAAAEVTATGVTINAVCPGYVDTAMTQRTIETVMQKTGAAPADALRRVLEATRQPRLVTTAEVAHAVLALCDAAAGAINGQALVLDGGGFIA